MTQKRRPEWPPFLESNVKKFARKISIKMRNNSAFIFYER